MRNQLFLGVSALALLCGAAAHAQQLDIQPVFNAPAPAPVYVAPYPDNYDPGHRRHDFNYWESLKHPQDYADHR